MKILRHGGYDPCRNLAKRRLEILREEAALQLVPSPITGFVISGVEPSASLWKVHNQQAPQGNKLRGGWNWFRIVADGEAGYVTSGDELSVSVPKFHKTNHEGSPVFRKRLRNLVTERPPHIPPQYILYTYPSTSPLIHVQNECQLLSTVSTHLRKNSSHLTKNGINNALSHTRLTIRGDTHPHPLMGKVTLQLLPSLCYDIPPLRTQPNQLIYQLKSCECDIRFHSSQRHIHDDHMNRTKGR